MRICATRTFSDTMAALTDSDRALLLRALRVLADAAAPLNAVSQSTQWPSQLRVREIAQTDAIFEMRWTLQRSDARITWQVRQDREGAFLLLRSLGGMVAERGPRRRQSTLPADGAISGR
ncbi:MAG: hypothetical protein ACP5PJ_09380 [Acidimicrobiales bacterium]